MFTEYKKQGTIDLKKFLIRRAFKVFPLFYAFILLTIAFDTYIADTSYSWTQIVAELLYVQNYFQSTWLHTWSLAVEEHFYLLLAFATVVVLKMDLMTDRRFVVSCLMFLLVLSFGMRLYVSYLHRHEDIFYFMRTHLRADGIIVGVLLSYLYYFTDFTQATLNRKGLLLILSTVLIVPGFYFQGGSFFMNVIGLTTVNLGFALVVLLALDLEKYTEHLRLHPVQWPIRLLGFVGANSYSVYLWHLNSKRLIYSYFNYSETIMTALYVVLSIAIGLFMSYIIEKNALKVRVSIWKKTTGLF